MKEPFDKKLTQKIRDSFEAHEEPFDPKEWERFSRTYFARTRKPIAAWWFWGGGIAASLLLVAIFWNSFTSTDTAELNTASLVYNPDEKTALPDSAPKNQAQGQPSSEPNQTIAPSSQEAQRVSGNLIDKKPSLYSFSKKEANTTLIAEANESQMQTTNFEESSASEKSTLVGQTLTDTQPIVSNSHSDELPKTVEIEIAQQQINSWLAQVGAEEQAGDIDEKTKQPLKLGVMMAPQNISNSTQNINFGAGVMSEIPFSKRLRLDVGIGYAQQNLMPNQNGPGGSIMSDAASVQNEKANLFAGNYISSSSELSFGQIEIPLNMKYSVIQKKSSDFYLVSGFSNMFYVNQEKTTTYNTVSFGGNAMNSASQSLASRSVTESPTSADNQVDVGQLVNLGMGFEQNLKNGTSLSFEPFYKFTIGDQTFINQRFAIGGINLRMNFQLKK